MCNARLESSADDCPLGKQERYPIPPDTTRYPEAEEDTTDTTWPDFKYYLPRRCGRPHYPGCQRHH